MALTPTVLTDAMIIINGTTISDHANKVEVSVQAEEKEITAFGQTYKARAAGTLKDGSLKITLMNDFSASQLDSIVWPLLGTVVTFEVRPTSAARSATNPAYTGSVFIKEWKPINGGVGDVDQVDIDWPTSGTVSRQIV